MLAHFRQDADAIQHALHGTEIGHVNQQLFALGRVGSGAAFIRVGMVQIAIDEVIDDADFVGDAEYIHRMPPQIFTDRSDPVGFLNRKFSDGEVGGVGAYQRDVGSVQRRDERQPALRSQHLLRQHGRDRVRDGVMHVQQIEIVSVRHIHHARRQRQTIRRILEQRIVGNFHFVIVDARDAGVEPNRIRIGDEVDFVAAVGKLESEFRRDDAAAAVSGVTRDSNVHRGRLPIDQIQDDHAGSNDDCQHRRAAVPGFVRIDNSRRQAVDQAAQFVYRAGPRRQTHQQRDERSMPTTRKSPSTDSAPSSMGTDAPSAIQPPFPSAMVSPCTNAAAPVPDNRPTKAPWPVVRFQNMPNKKVANSGAFTKENTNCSTSMMLL